MSVVCCQVEVSATGRSLVQMSPTARMCVCVCVCVCVTGCEQVIQLTLYNCKEVGRNRSHWEGKKRKNKSRFFNCTNTGDSRLKKSKKMQQYADIYLLLNYSTYFGLPSRPSSGVHKTVVAASGTDHTMCGASFFKHDQIISPYLVKFEEACSPDSMICTRDCNYSFMYSWWWTRWTRETCRVIYSK